MVTRPPLAPGTAPLMREQVFIGVNLDSFEILHGHFIETAASREAFALHDFRRGCARAHGTGAPVVPRAVAHGALCWPHRAITPRKPFPLGCPKTSTFSPVSNTSTLISLPRVLPFVCAEFAQVTRRNRPFTFANVLFRLNPFFSLTSPNPTCTALYPSVSTVFF